MGFRFQRRLNYGSGLGLNVSKSGTAPSIQTRLGSIGARGLSIRSSIPGLTYRKRWGGKKADAQLIGLVLSVISLGLILAISTSGCATTYWKDRAADLTDVIHVDLTGFSGGAVFNVGPAVLGVYGISGPQGHGERIKLGFGGIEKERAEGVQIGIIVPLSNLEVDVRSENGYGAASPPIGSVGFDIGFTWVGIGGRLDFVELIDFIIGFGSIDIVQDDVQA